MYILQTYRYIKNKNKLLIFINSILIKMFCLLVARGNSLYVRKKKMAIKNDFVILRFKLISLCPTYSCVFKINPSCFRSKTKETQFCIKTKLQYFGFCNS